MKKVIIGILLIVIITLGIFVTWYKRNIQVLDNIKSFNEEFEDFLNKDITGVDITTIMNRALENNNKYNIPKNKDGTYKDDKKYSIAILISPEDSRKILSNGSF